MEFLIIVLLLIVNGLLAMYEMALVSSGKIRLTTLSQHGRKSADRVLKQLADPEQTLSTIQIGITLVGIVSGAYGGVALAEDVERLIRHIPHVAAYAHSLALITTVGGITYLSLVLGELVPKAMALSNPERYAMRLSGPVALLTWLCYPIVKFLSISTKLVGRLLGVRITGNRPMTEEEIKLMLHESTEQGVIAPQESEMLRDVFRFSDRSVAELMTPRHELVCLHPSDTRDAVVETITKKCFSKYPLVDENGDHVIGIVSVKDIISLQSRHPQGPFPLKSVARPALYLPESVDARKAVELFKHHKTKFGVVINEYGGIEGIVTLHDLTESIFGDILEENETPEPDIVRRQDGSLLIEAGMNIDDFFEALNQQPTPDIREQKFNTVGGLAMYAIGRMPKAGDCFNFGTLTIEVVDMDGERVDKLLVHPSDNTPNT